MSALRIIHITDLHLANNDAVVQLREYVFRMQAEYKADAFFVTGDIVAVVPNDWEKIGVDYRMIWKDLGIPVFQCPGNHDLKNHDDTYDVSAYEKFCGPSNYTEIFKGFCIVGFNSLSGHSQLRLKQRARDLKDYEGCNDQWPTAASLTERELLKIKKNSKRKPIILLQHLAPTHPEMIRSEAVGVKAIFSGHWHASKINHLKDCWSYNSPNPLFGGIDGSPAGCMVVDFKKDGSSKAEFIAKESLVLDTPLVKRGDYKWSKSFSGTTERSAILDLGNQLIFTTWDRSGISRNICYAVNPQNGEVIWKRRTAQAIKRSLVHIDGLLIGNGYGGTVYAMDALTGKLRWTAAIGNGIDRFLNNSPMSNGRGHVYCGNHHAFVCLDVKTGRQIWQQCLGSEFAAACGSPVYDAVSNRILITQTWQNSTAHLNGRDVTGVHPILNADTGAVVHLHKNGVIDSMGVTACIDDGHVYSCSHGLYGSVFGSNTVVWSKEYEGFSSGSITMTRQGLCVPCADGSIRMLDPKNGFEIWSLDLGMTPVFGLIYSKTPHAALSDLTEDGAHMYFTAQDQYCYKVHTATGKVKAKIALPAMSLCKPLVRKDGIFITDYDGALHCLKAP